MAKASTVFYCTECGTESAKWLGQCPGCHAWNTMAEAPSHAGTKGKSPAKTGLGQAASGGSFGFSRKGMVPLAGSETSKRGRARGLSEIDMEDMPRFSTGFTEFDRVLGGGIVPGSLTLVGGDPGIGKSTILLQMMRHLAESKDVLYVSGEESLQQIKLRAERIGAFTDRMKLLCESDMDVIAEEMQKLSPAVCVIDSIQTMFRPDVDATPGNISQIREVTALLMQLAKTCGIAVFVVGHVTKEGVVAGPRILEHMVDSVLYLEGERHASYRILRGVKNRFGSTNEVGVFEMVSTGLKEVQNPSAYMLSGRPSQASGSVIGCAMEGTRAILIEVQALVSSTSFGFPRRTAVGIDTNRLNMLLAVLEKRARALSEYDAYVNIVGGLRLNEPSTDLAVALALASSLKDRVFPEDTVCFGEIGLSGEVRGVSQAAKRVSEAAKLGFKRIILSKSDARSVQESEEKDALPEVELVAVSGIREALDIL